MLSARCAASVITVNAARRCDSSSLLRSSMYNVLRLEGSVHRHGRDRSLLIFNLYYTPAATTCRFRPIEPIVLLHSMIGYSHHHVVRLSCCALTLSVSVAYRAKSCTRQAPICAFKHFCCTMYRLARGPENTTNG